jgi:hypothetical protein
MTMRRSRGFLSFALAAAVILAGSASFAVTAYAPTPTPVATIAAEAGVASGTVTEVREDLLRIMDSATERPVEFVINANTAVEGTVQVGSVVEVAYHDEDGTKTAVSIRVTQS